MRAGCDIQPRLSDIAARVRVATVRSSSHEPSKQTTTWSPCHSYAHRKWQDAFSGTLAWQKATALDRGNHSNRLCKRHGRPDVRGTDGYPHLLREWCHPQHSGLSTAVSGLVVAAPDLWTGSSARPQSTIRLERMVLVCF